MNREDLDEIQLRKQVLIEISTALYEKSTAYNNLILAAGYAAFFTTWSNTQPFLSEVQSRASVVSILISLLVFILWEIYKMVYTGTVQNQNAVIISASPEDFWLAIEKLRTAEQSFLIKVIGAWPIVLTFTLVPGLIGAGFLMWGLITNGMF